MVTNQDLLDQIAYGTIMKITSQEDPKDTQLAT